MKYLLAALLAAAPLGRLAAQPADLEVTARCIPEVATPGDTVRARISVANPCAQRSQFLFWGELPPGLELIDSGVALSTAANGSGGATLSLPAREISSGETAVFELLLRLRPGIPDGAAHTLLCHVSGDGDPNSENDSAAATVLVLVPGARQADLSVEAVASVPWTLPGSCVTDTFRVTNAGPDRARYRLRAVIPWGVDVLSFAQTSGPSADHADALGGAIVAEGPLEPGESATFDLEQRVPAETSLGTVFAIHPLVKALDAGDPDPSDNWSAASFSVEIKAAASSPW